MPEEVLFESEQRMDNTDIARYLRTVADKVENGEPIRLEAGSQAVELATDRPAVLEIKAEREDGEESLELEIEWDEGGDAPVDIS